MVKTSIQALAELGQSAWLDNISRKLIETGKLKELIGSGLLGMTSNPSIFDKSISSTNDYDSAMERLAAEGKTAFQIYDELTVRDVQEAADIFKPVYEKTMGADGYVSLEVNPNLAMTTKETLTEARRLFKKVNRPNLMIKVPATDAGFPAIEELISDGTNVNATLIFSRRQYENTAQAYIRGLQKLSKRRSDLSGIASVASVFISRIDTSIDSMLDEQIENEKDGNRKKILGSLKGKAAVANSKLIYGSYLDIFSGDGFKALSAKGGRRQRVLWASTSTKNPAYSDIKYVSELIARDTVNTIPDATLSAFLDHGIAKEAVTDDVRDAEAIVKALYSAGIDIDAVCAKLLEEGTGVFVKSFNSLISHIDQKTRLLAKR